MATALHSKEEGADVVALLKACAKRKDLHRGAKLHSEILRSGLLAKSLYVASALVSMYAKCGDLAKARWVFDELPVRNVVSWNALITGFAQQGQGEEALTCFYQMQYEGYSPNAVTFICALKACGSVGAVDKGEQIHDEVVNNGLLERNIMLGNALVDMYVRCGALARARQVLDELPVRDVVSWNVLIAGYVHQGQGEEALKCFIWMEHDGHLANAITFVCVLTACGSVRAGDKGEQIHDEVVKRGLLERDLVLGNALLHMYVKCGAFAEARQVIDELLVRDVVSWNVLIAGYAHQGQGEEALKCFDQMQCDGCTPDPVTFVCILRACGTVGAVDKGEQIHGELVKQELLKKNTILGNALVDMYVKCGALAKARQVFDELPVRDVITWSALIAGYAQHGEGEEALHCFERMQCEGHSPNAVTFICTLKACASVGAADKGKQIHNEVAKQGLLEKNVVLGTALVDMYAKCGALVKAQRLFVELPVKDVISWIALIAGYAQHGQPGEALNLLKQMRCKGHSPDVGTFICILKACASVGAVDTGQQIYDEVVKHGLLEKDIVLGTALVDMYAKCGVLAKAQEVLDKLPVRNVVSWNALITGYAQQGQGREVLKCFERMQCDGLIPDSVTLVCVLNACSHSGLLEEGQMYFANMSTKYGIMPGLDHHCCMVDLFGRAGEFHQALAMIEKISSSSYLPVWHALLGACRKWGNVKLGRLAFDYAVKAHESDPAVYVCMANIYAAGGMQENTLQIEVMRSENKA